MIPNRTAFVFSTDEAFAALAKGLVLSLDQCAQDRCGFDFFLIDIGCSSATLDWMTSRNVTIVKFSRDRFLRRTPRVELKPYQDAQLCRPFLPQLIPGYSIYVWCDSDIWIQDARSVCLYRDTIVEQPEIVAISPLIDVSYKFYYENAAEFSNYARMWYSDAYGPTLAETYANRAILSSGLFAMHATNSIWDRWARELEAIYARDYAVHGSLHVAEQTALNYLLYSTGRFVPLEAIHNYNCHIGCAKRKSETGAVVIDMAPVRTVGVVHLTYASKMISQYIDQGLLFESGRYLAAEELRKLRTLSHY